MTEIMKIKPVRQVPRVVREVTPDGAQIDSIANIINGSEVKNILFPLRCSKENGMAWELRGKLQMTALGCLTVAKLAGIRFISPTTIPGPNGTMVLNPIIDEDKDTGGKRSIHYYSAGIGRTPTGELTVCSYSMLFDLRVHQAEEFYSRWNGKRAENDKGRAAKENRPWGVLTGADEKPKPENGRSWKAIRVPDGDILWVDRNHPEVRDLLQSHMSLQKFAYVRCITMCRRNIVWQMGYPRVIPPNGIVNVVAWPQTDRDIDELREIMAAAEAGKMQLDEKGEAIVAASGQGHINQEDREPLMIDEIEEGAQTDEADFSTITKEQADAIRDNLRPINLNPVKAAEIRRQYGIESDDEIDRLSPESANDIRLAIAEAKAKLRRTP